MNSSSRTPIVGRAALAALAVALLLGITARGEATTLQYQGFEDLVAKAEGIVVGTVASVESHYAPDREIYTFVTLYDLEIVDGAYDRAELGLRLLGGEVDGDVLHVEGAPEFVEGDRVLVFLHGNGRFLVPTVGWTQGIFKIRQDRATGREVVEDHDGNRVFAVRAGEIDKEHRFSAEAQIVGDELGAPGAADDGSESLSAKPEAEEAREAMELADFVAAIRQQSALSGKRPASIHSIDVLDLSVPADAARDAAQAGEAQPLTSGDEASEPFLPKPIPQTATPPEEG